MIITYSLALSTFHKSTALEIEPQPVKTKQNSVLEGQPVQWKGQQNLTLNAPVVGTSIRLG